MTATRIPYPARPLVLALQAALAMIALAATGAVRAEEDADVSALVQPTNIVEIGVGANTKESAKFGEYNGLYRQGPSLVGNIWLRGGDAWGQGSGTRWWSLRGTDLGTESRNLQGAIGDQGRWSLGLEYDSLSHRISDSYQTPLVGPMGGNSFIMPPEFGVVSSAAAARPFGAQALTPAQQAFFHGENVHSDRHTTTLSGGYNFDARWNVRLGWSRVEQSGAKLMTVGTDPNVRPSGTTFAGYRPGAETIEMIMNPTRYTTDNVTAELNWVGERAFMTATALYSHFVDDFATVSFSNPFTPTAVANGTPLGTAFPVNQMSTMPGNNFLQFGASGGYNFTRTTRLVGSLSLGTNRQNQPFVNQDQMQPGGLPQASLNGHVDIKHADLRLTDRSIKGLGLGATFRYDERDNRTTSASYDFFDIGGAKESSVNTPMSWRHTQFELTGDHALTRNQNLRLALGHDQMRRWCNNDLANNAQGELSTTNAGYYTTASCVQVPESSENKASLTWRAQATDDVRLRLTGNYANRKSTINPSFYNPMQANDEGFENFGYVAFFQASRRERGAKAMVDWQATKALDLSLSANVAEDHYGQSPLGVQNGRRDSVNLDATYQFSPRASASVFATWQHRTRDLLTANGRNAVAPLPNTWTNNLADDTTTLGLSFKQAGLLKNKLELQGDLVYSRGVTSQRTDLNFASPACTAPSAAGFNCGPLPDIRSRSVQLRLAGTYHVDQKSSVLVGVAYQKLNAEDYLYNFYQTGFSGATTMPTNQQSPSYTQYRLVVAYRYAFR